MVTIVIVNWNGCENTLACLESLKKLDHPDYSVVIVDNASSDESEATLRVRHPEHTILQSGSNVGFAGGANLGIAHALRNGADHVLLLNNDTEVDRRLLTQLLEKSDSDPRIGVTGGRIDHMSPEGEVWALGAAFNVNTGSATHFMSESQLKAFIPNGPWYLYVPGCLMLLKRTCMEDIGMFSERYFHLAEDVEYCVRAQNNGWKICVAPEATVRHKGSASMARFSPLYNYYEQRNRLFVIQQYRTAGKSFLPALHDVLRIATRLLLTLVTIDRFRNVFGNARFLGIAVYDFFCGHDGKREDDPRYHPLSPV